MFRGVLTFKSQRPGSTATTGLRNSSAGDLFLSSMVSVSSLIVCVHRPHSVTLTSSTSFWPSGFMTMADMAVPGWSRLGNMRCVAVVVTPATPGCGHPSGPRWSPPARRRRCRATPVSSRSSPCGTCERGEDEGEGDAPTELQESSSRLRL